MTAQLSDLAFVYGQAYTSGPAEELADLLISSSDGAFQAVNFVSGGSEAVESCIKLVSQYWWQKGQPARSKFIGRSMSYHGNTIGALSVGHHSTRRAPYEAILARDVFHHVSPAYYKHYSHDDESEEAYARRLAQELEEKILELGTDKVAAFFAEPMVGATSGCVTAPKSYWPLVREVCDKYGVLLVYDEVMSGMWRVGSLFAFNELCDSVAPDILACAKGLGSGYVSIGAMFVSGKVMGGIKEGPPGTASHWFHGHTYTGHPVACAGALAVQKIIRGDGLASRIKPLGARLAAALRAGLADDPFVSDIRGHGLFWAVEFSTPLTPKTLSPRFAARVQARAHQLGIITLGMSGTTDGVEGEAILLAPAFITTEEEMDKIAEVVVQAAKECWAEAQNTEV